MKSERPMPRSGAHRGVALFALQSQERIEIVVRPEIDAVHEMTDPKALFAVAIDPKRCPEARLLAHAKCEAAWLLAAEGRMLRPIVDLDRLRAGTAGLDVRNWADRTHHGSLLDVGQGVPRDEELLDEDLERLP